MYVKLTIPERLQDLRKERHLTLEQLAEQTGLSKSALGKYETDDYKDISPFAIATLANSMAYPRTICWGCPKIKITQTQSFRLCI